MSGAVSAEAAIIIPFPAARPLAPRFTPADRAMLVDHRATDRLVAGLEIEITCDPDFGEFASFTHKGHSWSAWNVAPKQGLLALWNGWRGVNLGLFDRMCCVFNTLDLVLLAASPTAMQPSNRPVVCPHLGKSHVKATAASGCSCAVQCGRLSLAS